MMDETHTTTKLANDSRQIDNRLPGMESATAAQVATVRKLTEPACELITPEMLTLIELDQPQIDSIVQTVPNGAKNVQDIYPLSPLQESMLSQYLLGEQSATHVFYSLLELKNHIQPQSLINAIQKVVNRHDVLRSAVIWERLPRPVQIVCRQATLPVDKLDLDSCRDAAEQLREPGGAARHEMNLQLAPLMRLKLAADASSDRWHALLQLHPLVCDYQSWNAVLAEAMACLDGCDQELNVPSAYRNYVAWTLAHSSTQQAESFFRSKLLDLEVPTAPFDMIDMSVAGNRNEEAARAVDPTLTRRLRVLAQRFGVTVSTLFHVAWGLVIARTSGRDDIVYGTVLSAEPPRSAPGQAALGMFVNTSPLRLRLSGLTVRDLVGYTNRELLELSEYSQIPVSVARRCSHNTGKMPLFTSVLNCRYRFPTQKLDNEGRLDIRVIARGEPWTSYPVTLTVDDSAEDVGLTVRTDGRIAPDRMAGYVHTALGSLVEALQEAPNTPALTLSILSENEIREVVEVFNATHARPPDKGLIHELFEEQVERNPRAVAVVDETRSLTYAELNCRANQLARYLRTRGVGPDQLVAICVTRNVEMLIGVLGVLKAGGAYVPLDPNNPVERLEHVLRDAAARALLTQETLREALPPTVAEVITLDGHWGDIDRQGSENLDPKVLHLNPDHLAYVIYTSGSTGKPKGVMVEHRNLVNYALHALHQFDVASGSGSLVCSSISFDLTLTSLYPVLLGGRTVRLCREQEGLPALADELLQCRNLAPLKLTPSHLKLLEQPLREGQLAARIRVLVLGGEPLTARAVRMWKKHAPDTRIFNHYGPTETTVGCIVYEIGDHVANMVPIGRPISNTRIYILDGQRQIVPIGVVGEIYVAGAGVARGYLRRPDLTAERFLPDPFSADPHTRMYKTGDLGRWRSDGTIEYLGRNDQQVKIRGYRIELAEIEAQLVRHEQVRDAAIIVREDVSGEKRLVAYVTQRERTDLTVEALRAHARTVLPEYMVPSAIVIMESLPLTPNGKLDFRALPTPDIGAYTSRKHEPPQGGVEEVLATVWQELLGARRVGRQDDFFELGGDSLRILPLIARIAEKFHIQLQVHAIFQNPTIWKMAELVEKLVSEQQGHSVSSSVELEEVTI